LAVEAFRQLPQERLLVVGEGRDAEQLSARARANVTFLGRRSRSEVRELLRGCKAFLFPGLEDFGIAPVEALSCGRPVVAFAGGGALDTVVPGVTGEFFTAQTVDALLPVLRNFDAAAYRPADCRAQAEKFSRANFQRKLLAYLAEAMEKNAGSSETTSVW
jgi:glycosyltransferase involved in cell wall biosynthesis